MQLSTWALIENASLGNFPELVSFWMVMLSPDVRHDRSAKVSIVPTSCARMLVAREASRVIVDMACILLCGLAVAGEVGVADLISLSAWS